MPSDVTAEEAFDTAEMKQTRKKKEAPLLKSGGQSSLLTSGGDRSPHRWSARPKRAEGCCPYFRWNNLKIRVTSPTDTVWKNLTMVHISY